MTTERIKRLIEVSGPKGRNTAEIQAALRLQRGAVGDRLRRGYLDGLWFRGGEEKHYRYFSTPEFCAAYPFADEAAERAEKSKEIKRLRAIRDLSRRRGDRPAKVVIDYWPSIETFLRSRGRQGATMVELAEAVNMNRRTVWVWVGRYIDDGRVYTVGRGAACRYYIEKPETECVVKKVSPWRAESPTKRNTITPRKNVEIIVPDHIEVKHCPRSEDYRFSVSPYFVGEFTREWKERRA